MSASPDGNIEAGYFHALATANLELSQRMGDISSKYSTADDPVSIGNFFDEMQTALNSFKGAVDGLAPPGATDGASRSSLQRSLGELQSTIAQIKSTNGHTLTSDELGAGLKRANDTLLAVQAVCSQQQREAHDIGVDVELSCDVLFGPKFHRAP